MSAKSFSNLVVSNNGTGDMPDYVTMAVYTNGVGEVCTEAVLMRGVNEDYNKNIINPVVDNFRDKELDGAQLIEQCREMDQYAGAPVGGGVVWSVHFIDAPMKRVPVPEGSANEGNVKDVIVPDYDNMRQSESLARDDDGRIMDWEAKRFLTTKDSIRKANRYMAEGRRDEYIGTEVGGDFISTRNIRKMDDYIVSRGLNLDSFEDLQLLDARSRDTMTLVEAYERGEKLEWLIPIDDVAKEALNRKSTIEIRPELRVMPGHNRMLSKEAAGGVAAELYMNTEFSVNDIDHMTYMVEKTTVDGDYSFSDNGLDPDELEYIESEWVRHADVYPIEAPLVRYPDGRCGPDLTQAVPGEPVYENYGTNELDVQRDIRYRNFDACLLGMDDPFKNVSQRAHDMMMNQVKQFDRELASEQTQHTQRSQQSKLIADKLAFYRNEFGLVDGNDHDYEAEV